jgi:predicted aminopeptidase
LAGLALSATGALAMPGCTAGYVVRSGLYQAELLASREPVDRVLASGELSAGEEQRLRLVADLKAWGRGIGLESTENYDTVAIRWNRTIWNLTACKPLAFEAKTWWFPIVGRVPYLGFFDSATANTWRVRLERDGLDTWLRTAGAYSTLGWFRDPILPEMLRWSEADLAETVFHELAHATLWIPGSVAFNESFASVVGVTAARQWLRETFGERSDPLDDYDTRRADAAAWRKLVHGLYKDLDAVYRDPALDEATKAARKEQLFAGLPDRLAASEVRQKVRYQNAASPKEWNNARLMQFKTYNAREDLFAGVLERCRREVTCFIEAVRKITDGRRDPFRAMEEAVKNP